MEWETMRSNVASVVSSRMGSMNRSRKQWLKYSKDKDRAVELLHIRKKSHRR